MCVSLHCLLMPCHVFRIHLQAGLAHFCLKSQEWHGARCVGCVQVRGVHKGVSEVVVPFILACQAIAGSSAWEFSSEGSSRHRQASSLSSLSRDQVSGFSPDTVPNRHQPPP